MNIKLIKLAYVQNIEMRFIFKRNTKTYLKTQFVLGAVEISLLVPKEM